MEIYEETFDTTKVVPERVRKLSDILLEYRKQAKVDLIEAIGNFLDDDQDKIAWKCGCRGHWSESQLPGKFYVNYSSNLAPCSGTGKGDESAGLELYRWIPVKYKDEETNQEYNYTLDLTCGDFDIGTGEFHTNFTKLQMHKVLYIEGDEIGGQNINEGELKETEDLLGYYVPYRCYLSFPAAVRGIEKLDKMLKKEDEKLDKKGKSKQKRKQESKPKRDIKEDLKDYKHDYAPWDHDKFGMKPPIMNLTDDNYDAKEVAHFFLKLIVRDIEEESKKLQN